MRLLISNNSQRHSEKSNIRNWSKYRLMASVVRDLVRGGASLRQSMCYIFQSTIKNKVFFVPRWIDVFYYKTTLVYSVGSHTLYFILGKDTVKGINSTKSPFRIYFLALMAGQKFPKPTVLNESFKYFKASSTDISVCSKTDRRKCVCLITLR